MISLILILSQIHFYNFSKSEIWISKCDPKTFVFINGEYMKLISNTDICKICECNKFGTLICTTYLQCSDLNCYGFSEYQMGCRKKLDCYNLLDSNTETNQSFEQKYYAWLIIITIFSIILSMGLLYYIIISCKIIRGRRQNNPQSIYSVRFRRLLK